jgi:hypothetical protein
VPRLAQRRVILFFWPTRALIPSLSRDVDEPDLYRAGLDALFAPERFQSPCDQAIANAAGRGVVKELQSLRQSCTAAGLRG